MSQISSRHVAPRSPNLLYVYIPEKNWIWQILAHAKSDLKNQHVPWPISGLPNYRMKLYKEKRGKEVTVERTDDDGWLTRCDIVF